MALSPNPPPGWKSSTAASPCSPSTSPAAGPTRSARPSSATWSDASQRTRRPHRPARPDPAQRQARHVHRRRRPQGTRRRPARSRTRPAGWCSAASTSSPPSRRCRIPTVAAIDGACMGGGTGAGPRLRLPPGRHAPQDRDRPARRRRSASSPAGAARSGCTRLIGPSLAAEMICAGEAVKAERARQLGIVFDVVPSERLLDEALPAACSGRSRPATGKRPGGGSSSRSA